MQLDAFKDLPNGKKNVRTFLIGSICWILLASFLFSKTIQHTNFFIITLKNFFQWFVAIDVVSIAIIYKLYYNRSIFNEVVEITQPKEEKVKKEVEPNVEKREINPRKVFNEFMKEELENSEFEEHPDPKYKFEILIPKQTTKVYSDNIYTRNGNTWEETECEPLNWSLKKYIKNYCINLKNVDKPVYKFYD